MLQLASVQEPVRAAIWYALDNYCYEDAVFLAERLNAEIGSLQSAYLLATCHYRSGRVQQAKHLLTKQNIDNYPQACLLYGRCCLDLKEYKSGLLVLNGLLCLHESSETELATRFGSDAGVAFSLLGELNARLKQTKQAVGFFRAALKCNPFLWSAFQSLCELGEPVTPEASFIINEYPVFLRHHHSHPHTSHQAPPFSTTAPLPRATQLLDLTCPGPSSGDGNNAAEKHNIPPTHSLATPGNSNGERKITFVTPDLFDNPVVGKAVASSTPAAGPRSLVFTGGGAGSEGTQEQGNAITDLPSWREHSKTTTTGRDGVSVQPGSHLIRGGINVPLSSGRSAFTSVRGALDFGSGGSSGVLSGRGGGGGHLRRTQQVALSVTPLAPSFGVLPLTTPITLGSSAHHPSQSTKLALDFSTITPSPTPLSTEYTKLLQSAPKMTSKYQTSERTYHSPIPMLGSGTTKQGLSYSTPSSEFTSPVHFHSHSHSTAIHPLMLSTTKTIAREHSTNRIASSVSHDVTTMVSTSEKTTPTGGFFKAPPPKSAIPLRRSARLSKETGRRLSEHAIHSTRTKSRLKSPSANRRSLDSTAKKGTKVTFNTPLASRGLSSNVKAPEPKRQATSTTMIQEKSKPVEMEGVESLSQDENVPDPFSEGVRSDGGDSVRGVSGDGGEAVRSDGVKAVDHGEQLQALVEQQQVLLEQAAMVGIASLMQLLQKIGLAYQALTSYDLGTAVHRFQTLPPHHYDTPWVLSQVARAYFAGERFKKCANLFKQVHKTDPHRQEGMELYASALWHLQNEVELSVLSQTLHSSNKMCPEGLCAMATVMNLYKDHEAAIKYLQRALQVCPHFTYAHTLLGHEYWLAKDYDKALSSFQEATTINPRHYNAWYGKAHVYYAQEKYNFAEIYARRAQSINKSSSIASTQLALALFRQGEFSEALQSLDRAIATNSTNPIPKFHKAKVLEAMGQLEEALKLLDTLTVNWPREPNLYISKGKILKRLNRSHEAVLQFSWALDFSQTGSNSQLREEIDQAYLAHNPPGDQDMEDSDFAAYSDPDRAPLGDVEGDDVMGDSVEGEEVMGED